MSGAPAYFDPDDIGRVFGDAIPPDAEPPRDFGGRMATYWTIVGRASAAPTRQIVDGLISEDELAMIYAFGGTGKSLFGLELAIAVRRGEPFLGRFATTTCRVGILDEESAPGRLGGRLLQLARGHDIEPGDERMPLFEVAAGHRVDTEAGLEAIWQLIAANDLEVLVIDTMRRVHQQTENDSDGMSRVAEALLTLRRRARTALGHPLTEVLIHHSPKPREGAGNAAETMARGSGDIFAAVDSAIYLRKVKIAAGSGAESDEIVVEHAKARWSEPVGPFRVRVEGDDESVRLAYVGEASDEVRQSARAEQVIAETLAQVGGHASRKALIAAGESAGVSKRTCARALQEMARKGAITPTKDGRETTFRLTGDGALL